MDRGIGFTVSGAGGGPGQSTASAWPPTRSSSTPSRTAPAATELDLGEHAISNDGNLGRQHDHPAFVTHVSFGSLSELASGDTHGVDDIIEVVVEFSEPVEVNGSPQLELTIGSAARIRSSTTSGTTRRASTTGYRQTTSTPMHQHRSGRAQAQRRHHPGSRRQRCEFWTWASTRSPTMPATRWTAASIRRRWSARGPRLEAATTSATSSGSESSSTNRSL